MSQGPFRGRLSAPPDTTGRLQRPLSTIGDCTGESGPYTIPAWNAVKPGDRRGHIGDTDERRGERRLTMRVRHGALIILLAAVLVAPAALTQEKGGEGISGP